MTTLEKQNVDKTLVLVYVPKPGTYPDNIIVKKSGIVGKVIGNNIKIYFEGNIYKSSTMQKYEDRLFIAWGRMHCNYPTVATMAVPATDLIEVGRFDPISQEFYPNEESDKVLEKWLL